MVRWETSLRRFHIGRNHAGTPVALLHQPIASVLRSPTEFSISDLTDTKQTSIIRSIVPHSFLW